MRRGEGLVPLGIFIIQSDGQLSILNSFAGTTADLAMVESTQQLCAIQECQKPCYVDESGTVHKCCGITRAREFQKENRTSGPRYLIKIVYTDDMEPGKEMDPIYLKMFCFWFNTLLSGMIIEPPTEALMLPTFLCSIPECHKPCSVEEDGTVHEFCGYTHAMEYQRWATQQQGIKLY